MIRVILPAREIPDNGCQQVTKLKGEKIYTLKGSFSWFDSDGQKRDIHAEDSVFLMDKEGHVFAVRNDTPLIWSVDEEDLIAILEDRIEGEDGGLDPADGGGFFGSAP